MRAMIIAMAVIFTLGVAAVAGEFSAEVDDAYETHTHKTRDGQSDDNVLDYRLLCPQPLRDNTKYPLIVYLHGSARRGDDNRLQLEELPALMVQKAYVKQFPCYVFAPQCPVNSNWEQQCGVVLACIDELIAGIPIDTNRIYLTGYSMGGNGCWHLAARRRELFAAVVPVAGRSETAFVPQLLELPIWIVHGNADEVVPVENSREMFAALNDAGGDVGYTELPNVAHDSWRQAYRPDSVMPWMFGQSSRGRWWKRNWLVVLLLTADALIAAWIVKTAAMYIFLKLKSKTSNRG